MIFHTDDQNGGNRVQWSIISKENSILSNFFSAYSQRTGIKVENLCFKIERTSEIITFAEGEIEIGAFIQEGDQLVLY